MSESFSSTADSVCRQFTFLVSSLTEYNPFMKTEDFMEWFVERQEAHRFVIEEIPFRDLTRWGFAAETGNLCHDSGKFFSIEGIRVLTNFGSVASWTQPIINQPEIGILGIITKKIDGILYFLMQAKMEPGNINMIQLAPTLQATRSNFTRVHQGKSPPYLEYFLDKSNSRTLLDVLQSEQGARFLRKRNRNMIIEVDGDLPVLDDYCWLTLGQIHKILRMDNIVNMDARTVLSCIPFGDPSLANRPVANLISALRRSMDAPAVRDNQERYSDDLIASVLDTQSHLNATDDVISWFTDLKVKYELEVESIPLDDVRKWTKTEMDIHHDENQYFSVIACRVEADNREVTSWTQPLVKAREPGIVAMLIRRINGVCHFLVQAKVEPGNFDTLEMAPTVQCITGSYNAAPPEGRPPYLDYVLNASEEQIRFSTLQSEEGGRFFREENRNIIIEVEDDFPEDVPENYIWMTMSQLKDFIKYNNFVNVQCRCLMASLGFV